MRFFKLNNGSILLFLKKREILFFVFEEYYFA